MNSKTRLAVTGLSAGLLLATPVIAQTKDVANPADGTKQLMAQTKDTANPATDITKQKTQGAPAGFKPTPYGSAASKQQTAGAPVGSATKQQTAGAPVGFATKQQTAGAPVGFSAQKQQ